jgi:hypothetical protein
MRGVPKRKPRYQKCKLMTTDQGDEPTLAIKRASTVSPKSKMPPESENLPTESLIAGGPGTDLIIEAGRSERHYWRDLWRYRELFRVLAWRDISVRYKQTVVGAAWALIRPFLCRNATLDAVFNRLVRWLL